MIHADTKTVVYRSGFIRTLINRYSPDLISRAAALVDQSIYLVVAGWILMAIAGFAVLCRYSFTPGASAIATDAGRFASLGLPHAAGLPTLLMVVHPLCPCSTASMRELAMLAADCQDLMSIDVLFVQPKGLPGSIESTELWKAAEEIPGAHLIRDANGSAAAKIGAATSGQVYLFDANNRLQFSGGITSSRGHEGLSEGRSTLEALIHHKTPLVRETPVFGCPLQEAQ
ncbi:MAG: RedB protein [Tepidisphaeraceae bacterium]